MAQKADPRETRKPEARPESDTSTDVKTPPKPAIREIYSDWAML